MDLRLQQAAESGNTNALYSLIDENPYILENIDAVPFINTPLHVAAAAGNVEFAMEILILRPSLARKLNTSGHSPLHLAVNEDQRDFVLWMLKHDQSLACVKGRNGITPFHLLVLRGNVDLVADCLLVSPECVKDANVNGQNALHLAVMLDRFEVLQVLIGWIRRLSQKNALDIEIRFLNKEDFRCNTALHLAAYRNDLQAVGLLLECQLVERNKVNGDGFTFLDILRNLENPGVWDYGLKRVVKKTGCEEAASLPKPKAVSQPFKSPLTLETYQSTVANRLRSNSSEKTHGAFLIVYTLIITATYQTALQPPGGVLKSTDPILNKSDPLSIIKRLFLFLLWVFNTLGFYCALFKMLRLLPHRRYFSALFAVETYLGVSYALALAENSPDPVDSFVLTCTLVPCYFLFRYYSALVEWTSYRTVADGTRRIWFKLS